MEEKINIAKILKNKPEGTKLWTDMFGSVTLYVVTDACDAFQVKHHNKEPWFDEDGKLYKEGVLCIYPSKSMRDWKKFSWKKGDVLISDCGFMCIFKEWASDDYTKFNGCYFDGMPNTETAKYSKVDNNIAYGYIRDIENRCGGKLNLETLEIEKQTEFKDGDIVTQGVLKGVNVYIIKNCIDKIDNKYNYYARYNTQDKEINYDDWSHISPFAKFATDSEKQQLFEALAKEGKQLNSEKKKIVDLKPKVEFKPFDKVLCRNSKDDTWKADFFFDRLTRKEIDYTQSGKYLCVGDLWMYCIPYNEETAHLLGTTDEWKGGEGC